MVALLPLAACEGDNRFTGDSVDLLPRVTAVTLPSVAHAGEAVDVRVDATGSHGISDLVVSVHGAVVKDTTVRINPPRSRLSQVLAIPVPGLLQDTLLVARAYVIDRYGNVSQAKEAVTVAFGPPVITSVSAPSLVRPGEPVSVRVTAHGSRRISQLDVVARGAIETDSTISVAPPRNNVTQDLVLVLPQNAPDTLLTLAVGVQDEAGQTGNTVTKVVPLAIEPPTVSLSAPATVRAGASLDVDVSAQAARQVAEIRLELRGALVKDTAFKVTPTQSSLTQHITVLVPGNITLSELRVRAIAIDRGGAVAYSETQTVTIPLGPPVVTSLEVPSSATSGGKVDVRVRAQGDRPLMRVDIRFRGAADHDGAFLVQPQSPSVIMDASVQISATPKDSILIVSATATDVSGAVSEIVSTVVPVIVPSPDPASVLTRAPPMLLRGPLLAAAAALLPWRLAAASAEPAGYALPARRRGTARAGRKRMT